MGTWLPGLWWSLLVLTNKETTRKIAVSNL